MKTLQICGIFPPQPRNFPSGVTQAAYHISKELARSGHSVEVWAANTLDVKPKIESRLTLDDGIEVHYFPYMMRYQALFLSPSLVKAARSRLSEFDVIHIHNFRTFEGPVIAYYAKKGNVPYLLQAHGSVPRMIALQGIKQVYDAICGYELLRNASKVIAVTKIEAKQYRTMGVSEDKIEIIPNGIDLSEFQTLPQRGQFRENYGIGAKQKVVLYLGRIHKIKSPDMLVESFAELTKELPDVRLAIVGPDRGYLTSLRQLVNDLGLSDKIIFTGPLYGKEKLAAYVDADVYALPSIYEVFGLTVLEACACSTPVVVTDRCGLANWVESYQAGYVVPYDRAQFRHALATILADEKLRQQMGKQAKTLAEEQFAWNVIVKRVETTYKAIMNDSQSIK